MQAFMAGKIKVQGDMTKLMAMQQGAPDPGRPRSPPASKPSRTENFRPRRRVVEGEVRRKAGAVASSQWLGITASGTPPRWVKD